jgi:hypothetical protein
MMRMTRIAVYKESGFNDTSSIEIAPSLMHFLPGSESFLVIWTNK